MMTDSIFIANLVCDILSTIKNKKKTRKLSSIEDRGHTDRVRCLGLGLWFGLGLGLTLTFSARRAMVMTHTHAKDQGHRSVGSKDRVETDRWTYAGDCINSHANTVNNNIFW